VCRLDKIDCILLYFGPGDGEVEAEMVKRRKMRGIVQRIIKPLIANQPEKAEIEINEADDLYKEIRVENEVADDAGQKAKLKPGVEVNIIVEADSSATLKKPD
jgi:hypothetical protein